MTTWEPHTARAPTRVTETSCCAAYEWCCEGGQFFILRSSANGYEETGRGRYAVARAVWDALVREHKTNHYHPYQHSWRDTGGTTP